MSARLATSGTAARWREYELVLESRQEARGGRVSVCYLVPVTTILIAFGERSWPGTGVFVVLIYAALAVGFVLTAQALGSERQANDTLVGIVRAGIVTFPSLDRVSGEGGVAPAPTGDE